MRRFSAHYVYTNLGAPLKNGVIEVDNNGEIVNIIDTKGELKESRKLEFYNGVIVPGFINSHCHLELSELKGKVDSEKGLPGFLLNIFNYKKEPKNTETLQAIEQNDWLMKRNGIVAVGDISNTNQTIEVKSKSNIHYHTFIELIGLGENAHEIFEKNLSLSIEFKEKGLLTSLSPHAPYSVSKELFELIKNHAKENNSITTIHNQETESENEMFVNGKGSLAEALISFGIECRLIPFTGQKSLESIYKFLPEENNILLVHNLYTTHDEINNISEKNKNVYWCLCPLSNLFIEQKIPNVNNFGEYFDRVTLGTDSLASNNTLSILEEMKALINAYPEIEFSQLIK